MIVRRIEVEGGFLDGLNLDLQPGLVTVIGTRGAGKTSLVELIRFALDAGRLTDTKEPYKHAKAVLDSGQVTLTLEVDGEEIKVSRHASDSAPRGIEHLRVAPPLILAQNEIEELGEAQRGQLNLIDGFRPGRISEQSAQARLHERIREATRDIRSRRAELANLNDQLAQLGDVVAAEEEAKTLEAQLNSGAEATKPVRAELEALTGQLSSKQVETALLKRNLEVSRQWLTQIESVLTKEPALHEIPSHAARVANGLNERIAEARVSLEAAVSSLARGVTGIELALTAASDEETAMETQARERRRKLEELDEGAGALAQRVSLLRRGKALSESLGTQIAQGVTVLKGKQSDREVLLAELEAMREKRFQERAAVVEQLNLELAPTISITLTRSGDFEDYSALLVELLKGSNMRYNTLAPSLAAQVSPRELALMVEAGTSDQLVAASGVDMDRAARVIGYLGSAGRTEDLLTVSIDDSVEISLLDGGRYKTSEELSTGQRCTTILPILLAEKTRGLIVDQPEDHLDNSFVVERVIRSLVARNPESQLVFTTHNANITVLGGADQVIVLASNGKRGYKEDSGPLDKEEIVRTIKAVMEGGEDAFKQRAAFYDAHPDQT